MTNRLIYFLFLLISGNLLAQDFRIEPVILLSGHSNIMSPVVIDSVLYFASDKKSDLMVTYLDENDNYFYKVYQVPIKNKLPKGRPSLFSENWFPFHQTAVTRIPNENAMAITQNLYASPDVAKRPNKTNPLVISKITKSNKGISRSKALGITIPRGSSMGYPAFTDDGKLMFFVSDMPGGMGGSDIYYCTKIEQGWTLPQNAGPNVNTEGNESTPFVSKSGKLFFASSGRENNGGMDLYFSSITPSGLSKSRQLDVPFNSDGDDFGLFFSDDEQWGYLCSNRDGKDAIYFFESLFPLFDESHEYEEENYCFTFYESSTENYDPNEFGFKWKFSDGKSANGTEVDHCFDGPAIYHVSLDVYDRVSGDELFTVSDYELNLERKEQVFIQIPATVKAGSVVQMSADDKSIVRFRPNNYFWEIDGGIKMQGIQQTHRFLLPGTYKVKCGVVNPMNPDDKICTYKEIVVTQ